MSVKILGFRDMADRSRASGLEFVKLLPASRRKKLCADVSCALVVREYKERQKNMTTPAPKALR